MNEDKQRAIEAGDTALGIEFGSTRIKAVLTDAGGGVLASGGSEWENTYADGLWTYGEDEIWAGLRDCYGRLKADVKSKFGVTLTRVGALGVSGMMHGYLALDDRGELLAPFRTWRDNSAESAARALTELFGFHIPARWSVAHLYRAMLDGEEHLPRLAQLTTLAGLVHYKLTGERVVGIGEASGMFPIDGGARDYDKRMLAKFDALVAEKGLPWRSADVLPRVAVAGAAAGTLTAAGARLLDPQGDLQAGIPLCPPEGDAGTGMVATNSVRPRTGNVSAGTSVFCMAVLERPLTAVYDAIDVVTTPAGDGVAMVHCNNCTSDLNAWAGVFGEFAAALGQSPDVHRLLCEQSLAGEPDCGGVLEYNYVSGENITGVTEGRPLVVRRTESRLTLANFARSQLYAAFATLKIGADLLVRREGVRLESVVGHGGLFKTEGVCQRYLAAALNAPVTVMTTAGEGGAWGMALLAAYMRRGGGRTLAEFLDADIFADCVGVTLAPLSADVAGFDAYAREFERGLPIVKTAVTALGGPKAAPGLAERLAKLKKEVFDANMRLVANGLVIYTWGNVSGIDRASGLVVIKPSGVDYDGMTADDMVVVDLDGNVSEGRYKPSSDTPTHLELYKAHPEIGGVVHTHSTYATAFAQAGRSVPAYGTTHADYFYGDVPCTRALTAEEVAERYERNTGVVINETLAGNADVMSVPAALVRNHGPFAWGTDAANAVYNATVLEQVARMALLTERLAPKAPRADKYLLDKHYFRKHGKNAYYGQK